MNRKTILSILAGMIFVQFLLHIPFLNNPPMGQHVWRQVVGHAMALNYHLEDDSFWSPRNDTRITDEHDGRIWHEFPLGYWLIGKSYDLTGYHDINARLIWLILSLFAIPFAYLFLRELGGGTFQSLLFTFFLTFAPYYFYYSITVVPNLHGLIWFMGGIAFIARPIREQKLNFRFLLGMVLVTLATLTKPTYLFFG